MKIKFKNLTLIIFIIFLFISIFINSSVVTSSISFSINLFIKNVFPSLFPMFMLTNLLIIINIPSFLSNLFSKITRILFKTKGISSFVFFMSLLSGFPSSGKYLKELLDKNLIDIETANKTLMFTFFSNPLFIINTVGIMFFNSKQLGFKIFIAHLLGNVLVGLLFRNLYYNKKEKELPISLKDNIKLLNNKISKTNIIKEFLSTINSTLLVLLNVFGTITCFLILINLINININPFFNILFKGLLEVTTGLKYLSLANFSLKTKALLATFLISFGGFSIHCQIFNLLNNDKIKYYPFLLARICHASFSTLLIYILF